MYKRFRKDCLYCGGWNTINQISTQTVSGSEFQDKKKYLTVPVLLDLRILFMSLDFFHYATHCGFEPNVDQLQSYKIERFI